MTMVKVFVESCAMLPRGPKLKESMGLLFASTSFGVVR